MCKIAVPFTYDTDILGNVGNGLRSCLTCDSPFDHYVVDQGSIELYCNQCLPQAFYPVITEKTFDQIRDDRENFTYTKPFSYHASIGANDHCRCNLGYTISSVYSRFHKKHFSLCARCLDVYQNLDKQSALGFLGV